MKPSLIIYIIYLNNNNNLFWLNILSSCHLFEVLENAYL